MIRNRISDLRSVRSPCIKGAGESLLRVDLLAPLMHSDLTQILFQIILSVRLSRVGFVQVMENQESHETLQFHFPGLESHGIL